MTQTQMSKDIQNDKNSDTHKSFLIIQKVEQCAFTIE